MLGTKVLMALMQAAQSLKALVLLNVFSFAMNTLRYPAKLHPILLKGLPLLLDAPPFPANVLLLQRIATRPAISLLVLTAADCLQFKKRRENTDSVI
ncbi:hypothetical protein C8Q69DRAFT_476053 [Paecilomyces variotii]|uniref:Uncharacterized protein n=1 Tax=Byssochlamys spectabilis TaxID=264951 RepID=A0A443HNH8_BYSSP|nr:hypothetical protein C8Q69DRAFT_476053 [Paecilomyces variotii]RWQ93365.1 hypothetical protein C8Q69DRAFT_476053 [Paecilomyces variotii]